MNDHQKQLKAERDRRYREKNRDKIATRRKIYRENNRDKTKEQQRRHRENNPDSVKTRQQKWYDSLTTEQKRQQQKRNRKNRQKTPENWIGTKIHQLGRRKAESTLTKEQVINLYNQQNGKCALSGITMTHQTNDLCSISIDRIDSNGPYDISNIQLVCKAINLAKNTSTNEEMKQFITLVRSYS